MMEQTLFSETEFLRIYNSAGALDAVKYMKGKTGMSLSQCKAFLDKCTQAGKHLSILQQGTITWFKCEDQLPPIANNDIMGKPSEKVIVIGPNGFPIQTYYVHDAKGWFSQNNIPFDITHWAYINLPE